MKLNNFTKLVFKSLEKGPYSAKELAASLRVEPANIAIWKTSKSIPDKHFKRLVKKLGIPRAQVIDALKKDINEAFK